jgi:hypothetical protein
MSKVGGEAKKLFEQREILTSGLPPFAQIVRGSLVTRYRRCGKPACHCVQSRGHGPAHYRVVTLKPGKDGRWDDAAGASRTESSTA